MPEKFVKPLLIVIAMSTGLWICFRITVNVLKRKKDKKFSIQSELILYAIYMYLVAVMTLTVIPLPFNRFEKPNKGGINIVPFKNIIKGLEDTFLARNTIEKEHGIENVFGNILMFVPLGILLPLFSNKFRTIQKVIFLAAICSASIELTQLISRLFEIRRFVDIDDLILNTSGAALGFIIADKILFRTGKISCTFNLW